MSLSAKQLVKIFKTQLDCFLADITHVFPNNDNLEMLQEMIAELYDANPQMVVRMWITHINLKYANEIAAKDIDAIVAEREVLLDPNDSVLVKLAAKIIGDLRGLIRELSESSKEKAMQHLSNLSQLADMWSAANASN